MVRDEFRSKASEFSTTDVTAAAPTSARARHKPALGPGLSPVQEIVRCDGFEAPCPHEYEVPEGHEVPYPLPYGWSRFQMSLGIHLEVWRVWCRQCTYAAAVAVRERVATNPIPEAPLEDLEELTAGEAGNSPVRRTRPGEEHSIVRFVPVDEEAP